MNRGIPLLYRRKFGNVDVLKSRNPKLHEVFYAQQDKLYIFYIVTKMKDWQKSSLEDLYKTLVNLI